MVAGLGDVRESPTPGTVARQVFSPLSYGAVRLDQVRHHCAAGPEQGGILTQGRAIDHKGPPEISGQGIVHGLLHGAQEDAVDHSGVAKDRHARNVHKAGRHGQGTAQQFTGSAQNAGQIVRIPVHCSSQLRNADQRFQAATFAAAALRTGGVDHYMADFAGRAVATGH